MNEFDPHIRIAVVFDVSKKVVNGRRQIDNVKIPLIKLASGLGLNGKLFVASQKNKDFGKNQGHGISMISNYESSELSLDVRQAAMVLVNEDEDCQKEFILITDRFDNKFYEKLKLPLILFNKYNQNIKVNYFGIKPCSDSFLKIKEENLYGGECNFEVIDIRELEGKLLNGRQSY